MAYWFFFPQTPPLNTMRAVRIFLGSKKQKIDRDPLLEAPTSIEWEASPPPAGTSNFVTFATIVYLE